MLQSELSSLPSDRKVFAAKGTGKVLFLTGRTDVVAATSGQLFSDSPHPPADTFSPCCGASVISNASGLDHVLPTIDGGRICHAHLNPIRAEPPPIVMVTAASQARREDDCTG